MAVVGLLAAIVFTASPSGAQSSHVQYEPPVEGVIVDGYRPPSNPYGAGNRGVDIATAAGAVVRAPADGVVTFAGQVGNDLFVVVGHADGVRTTMGFLQTVTVRAGQRVRLGDVVGTSSGVIHFGARRNGQYIDPLSLLAAGRRVRLVPTSPTGIASPDDDRRGSGYHPQARSNSAAGSHPGNPRSPTWA